MKSPSSRAPKNQLAQKIRLPKMTAEYNAVEKCPDFHGKVALLRRRKAGRESTSGAESTLHVENLGILPKATLELQNMYPLSNRALREDPAPQQDVDDMSINCNCGTPTEQTVWTTSGTCCLTQRVRQQPSKYCAVGSPVFCTVHTVRTCLCGKTGVRESADELNLRHNPLTIGQDCGNLSCMFTGTSSTLPSI